jgi:hypothetical protein
MQTRSIVESKACGIALYSTPYYVKIRSYEDWVKNNNFAEFWICIIRTPPRPSPKGRDGNVEASRKI